MKNRFRLEISSMTLHILAMLLMLCDHLWGTVVPGNLWLTCIGRLAYPLFAFMIVEGYFKTKNLKKYVWRLFVCALISEIPFNLVSGSAWLYPLHQNVLFTFLIGIFLIFLNEKARKTGKWWVRILTGIGTVILGFLLGLLAFVDYHYAGIFIILVFYFFRERKWWCLLGQIVCLAYISTEVISGQFIPIEIFGKTFELVIQSLSILALIPIRLYRGKQGPYNKAIRYLYYGFYPAHLLILGLIRMYLL